MRPSNRLEFTFNITTGSQVVLPRPVSGPSRSDGLWQGTCFELFLGMEDESYIEVNVSPNGQYNHYYFLSYRERAPEKSDPVRKIHSRFFDFGDHMRCFGAIEFDPQFKFNHLHSIHPTAVIEFKEGLTYWATNHPLDKPDFHFRDCWTILD
tara:strand:- start:76977 stop:77432 length:456 start_codon:yes stop_codon:yes gene_type:complete